MVTSLDTLQTVKGLQEAGFDEPRAAALTSCCRARSQDRTGGGQASSGVCLIGRKMEVMRRDLTIRLGSMMVVVSGVLLAAKFFG